MPSGFSPCRMIMTRSGGAATGATAAGGPTTEISPVVGPVGAAAVPHPASTADAASATTTVDHPQHVELPPCRQAAACSGSK